MLDLVWMFVVAVAGGLLPLLVRRSERMLHAALALATGLFLGAVFLHMLPELSTAALTDPNFGPQVHRGRDTVIHHDLTLWLAVLGGLLGAYIVEGLLLRTHDHDDHHRHKAVSLAALMGLSIHALTAGLAFAMQPEAARPAMLVAILAHKGFEAFSLTSVFQLAHYSRRRTIQLAVVFALVTPLGALVGAPLAEWIGGSNRMILEAVAAGTFLYVALCELLPEVFHHREDGPIKVALLATGVGLMWFVFTSGHLH